MHSLAMTTTQKTLYMRQTRLKAPTCIVASERYGTRDRNRLLPPSIHSADRREPLATKSHRGPLDRRVAARCSAPHPSSLVARRYSLLPCPAHPSKRAVMVALATAIVVHRKGCSLSNGFMRLKSSSICQRA